MQAKSKASKNYFRISYFSDIFRQLDKVHSYEYLRTKTPLELQVLFVCHLNDLGFEYEVKTYIQGQEKIEIRRDFPFLS